MKVSLRAALAMLPLAACSEQTSPGSFNGLSSDEISADEFVAAEPAPPAPNYSSRDGDIYMYVTEVSQEDREKGRATGDVVLFRYLGQRGDVYRLAILNESEGQVGVAECQNPCRVITERYSSGRVRRLGFSEDSVIGSAFLDAINGHLNVTRATQGTNQSSARIPARFTGEWNEIIADCGTGNNDTRLVIEPAMIRFYESSGEVQNVSLPDPRTLVVRLRLSGEGQTWTEDVRMVLAPSGDELTIGDFARHRCVR